MVGLARKLVKLRNLCRARSLHGALSGYFEVSLGRIVNSPCAAHHFAATGTLMKGAAALPCEAVKPPAAVQEVSAKRLENVALDWN